jgi:predicted secreted protein
MSITLGIALFFIIWWTTLFAVLPFGVRTQGESGEVVPGTPASAPVLPRLRRLFLINTLVAVGVFGVVWACITYGLITPDTLPNPIPRDLLERK